MKNAEYWIDELNLQAHPEGGYFSENYRAEETIATEALPERYASKRSLGTSIYFLITPESVSNFHRLRSDEIWHFHYGGEALIHMIDAQGNLSSRKIGSDIENGASFQVVIPHGTWFAAEVTKGDYILVGCTVSLGFEFEDFELADQQALVSAYPQHRTLIERFTSNG